VSGKLLAYFYPSTENNNVPANRIDRQLLKARVLSVRDGMARARIDGSMRMKHTFYHKDDNNFVEAGIVGYMDFDPRTKRICAFQLTTEDARYGGRPFGVVVRNE
jgi:hypothetical protein